MTKLTPKIILEGTRLTHKTELAFPLNEHPRIVGPRRHRYHSPLIHVVLCTRREGTWDAARAERLRVSGKPSHYDDLSHVVRQQELLRRLAADSRLPVLEIDMSDGDVTAACDRIADWMGSTGGLWPRQPAGATAGGDVPGPAGVGTA